MSKYKRWCDTMYQAKHMVGKRDVDALAKHADARIAELESKLANIDYWRDVYPAGMTAEQVANELADYKMILENVSLVYCHVTGGRISKGNTLAGAVIGEADAIVNSAVDEAVSEERQISSTRIAELEAAIEARDAEIVRLKTKVNGTFDAIREHTSRAATKRIFAAVKEFDPAARAGNGGEK